MVDVAKDFLSTVHAGPFLYRQEHLPLSRNQIAFLRQRFNSTEFAELVRRAAAATGHRSSDALVTGESRGELERFVDRTVNDETNGVHRSDIPLAPRSSGGLCHKAASATVTAVRATSIGSR